MKQIPIIRFSQFDDKWGSIAIGDLAQIKRGASPRPIQDPKWFDKNSDIGWLRISDVTEQNGRIKYLEQKISKLGQEKTRVLNTPHLLLSIAATVGKPVVNYVKTGVHDGFLIFENPKFDREFMFQWFDMFRPKWNKYGQPGSQVNLNSDIIRNHKMMIPSLPEQSAIGSLFRTLDDLLASYKDNLANYQSLKETMLSKMFPKAGQTVPEIRLDGFEGEWENIRLGDYAIIKGRLGWKSLKQEEYTEVGPSMIAGKHIKNGVIDWGEVDHIPQWRYDESPDIMLENGDIIFSKDGSLGNPALVSNLKGEATINSTMMLVRLNKKISSQFFYQVLTSSVFQKLIYLKVSGSSIPHLFQADMQDFKFYAPSIEEQRAIGLYFSNLDSLINSQQEKISQLETLKKKLLQDMFI